MIWTHAYDLILKLITMFLAIFFLLQIPYLEDQSAIVIILGIILFFVIYNLFARTLATFFYCKFTLKMDIDLNQAKQLNEAFSPIFPLNMKWLPMKELKDIEDANKFQIALDTFTNWDKQNKQKRKQQLQEFKNAGQKTKILTAIMYVLVGYFMIAAFMNLPPANYVTLAYYKLFDTDKYYPILNCISLVIPTILLFKAFDKNIK